VSIFFELHRDIPREGPGLASATRQAINFLPLPAEGLQILDIGCGPGMSALELARWGKGSVTALDKHQTFLDELARRAAAEGLSERIVPLRGDMYALDLPEGQFDLVWSEGAIYIIGFERGLREWRPLLRDGGYLVVSELSWLTSEPHEDAADFWNENYPGIRTVEENLQSVRDAGYEPLETFVLPEAGWWDEYYTPLEARVNMLREKYAEDAEALAVLDGTQQEIDLYRNCSSSYGYVFYLMQNK
jgi:SAM-dependent methyltransferase